MMSEPKFDNRKLLGRIKEIFGTLGKFGDAMHWSHTTTTKKVRHLESLTQSEITKIAVLLKIPDAEIPLYFFTLKV